MIQSAYSKLKSIRKNCEKISEETNLYRNSKCHNFFNAIWIAHKNTTLRITNQFQNQIFGFDREMILKFVDISQGYHIAMHKCLR